MAPFKKTTRALRFMEVTQLSNENQLSLSKSPILRYITFIVLYFSQGIPEGITIFAIPAWMAMNGKSALEITGYSAIIIIPFSLKILLAPIFEKFTYLPMGRRRPWILFGQFGILCSLIALANVPDPLNNMFTLTAVVLCVHVFIMFQDIATDSLVIDVVPIEQQGKANSFMWGSKTIGTSISIFIGSWLINNHGFLNTVLIMSISVFFIMFVPLFLRERKGEKLLPWTKGETSPDALFLQVDTWTKLFKSFKQAVLLKNTLFLLFTAFVAMAGMHFMRTMLPLFTIQELGWDNVFYSKIYSTSILAGGIAGMLIGAFIIQRYGIIHLIQGSLFLSMVIAVTMAFSKPLWENVNFVTVFIALFCIFLTLINIGLLALAMHLCWKRISAMQFTFCMTVFNAGMASGAALLGYLRSNFEWQMLFIAFGLILIISMIILKFIKTNRHREQVEFLESEYLHVLKAEGSLLVKSESA
ncbi:MAG: MFS transporter [Methylotenera sp.]|nr:MFS transporter [Flavobacterium sp.]